MGLFKKRLNNAESSEVSIQKDAKRQIESKNKGTDKRTTDNADAISLLDKHENGLLDDTSFIRCFGNATVFYSTPFGDHKDGNGRLFALPATDKTGYLPVFSSPERIKEFYENAGRLGFLIIEGTFISFLETIKKTNEGNTPIKFGAVIDPGYYGGTVDANVINVAIKTIEKS